ncbi:peptidoglycan-binding protein [Streptomyces sp. NPDC093094]|uniref:peptidoglycan-binding domain-containing protein n=1 Tax=Streptomyces sp. NPDC093094 TaxID=3366026 RepID=UPI00382CF6B9
MSRRLAALAAAAAVVVGGAVLTAAPAASAATSPDNCGRYSTQEPTLRHGATGAAVKALQCELNTSMSNTNLAIDGVFGRQTYDAVIRFQGDDCGFTGVDGVVGPRTWSALDFWSTYGRYAC